MKIELAKNNGIKINKGDLIVTRTGSYLVVSELQKLNINPSRINGKYVSQTKYRLLSMNTNTLSEEIYDNTATIMRRFAETLIKVVSGNDLVLSEQKEPTGWLTD